ncbi:hypothetical protein TruAng_005859 [Truncatella angustata]|nr:hypothetical protein TruAng_005859 [Truncatella angustata]
MQAPEDSAAARGIATNQRSPTKLFLRVLDQFEFSVNREENLQSGHFFQNLGGGCITDDNESQHHVDLDLAPSESQQLGITSAPVISASTLQLPLQYEAPAAEYAETAVHSVSSHGRSFSVLTDGTSITHPRHDCGLDMDLFSGIDVSPVRVSELPSVDELDIFTSEIPQNGTGLEVDMLPLFPWRIEFSWEAGRLIYAGEHLIGQTLGASTADSVTLSDDTLAASIICVAGTATADADRDSLSSNRETPASQKAPCNDLAEEIWYEFRQKVINILDDHFWRTCGARNPRKESDKSCHTSGYLQPSGSSRGGNRISKSNGRTKKQQQQRKGSSGDDNDEDSEEDNQSRPKNKNRQTKTAKVPVDCPFYKNNPFGFRLCTNAGFKRIPDLRAHLMDNHQQSHCESCLQILTVEQRLSHGPVCVGHYTHNVNFLTKEAIRRLRERADKDAPLPEQWLRFYRIIFPDAEPPFPSPYVEPHRIQLIKFFCNYLQEHSHTLLSRISQHYPPEQFCTGQTAQRQIDQGFKEGVAVISHSLMTTNFPGFVTERLSSPNDMHQSDDMALPTRHDQGSDFGLFYQGTNFVPVASQPFSYSSSCIDYNLNSAMNEVDLSGSHNHRTSAWNQEISVGEAFNEIQPLDGLSGSASIFNEGAANDSYPFFLGVPTAQHDQIIQPLLATSSDEVRPFSHMGVDAHMPDLGALLIAEPNPITNHFQHCLYDQPNFYSHYGTFNSFR